MNVLAFMIPVSILMGLIGLGAFIWALKSRQYEDLDGAANRILFEGDERVVKVAESSEPSCSRIPQDSQAP